MRISVPGIPQTILSGKSLASNVTAAEATEQLRAFIMTGNITALTGAGVSVDSGIRAYRGHDGRYMNPNYKPIFYHELMDESDTGRLFRQRYWLRSYLGYPHVRDTLPNTTHFAMAALQHSSVISNVITQNVDGLHHKALLRKASYYWNAKKLQDRLLELHGTLHQVRCKNGHIVDRNTFQDWVSAANPKWYEYASKIKRTNSQLRTNPDGDVAIEHLGISYIDFVVPECPACLTEGRRNSVQKPQVVFFGETIPADVKVRSYQDIETGDKLLIVGTTLATYSAFRLLKHALELKKPVLLLNVGPTRADGLPGVEKIEMPSAVMRDVARAVLGANTDSVVDDMLRSGIVKPPSFDDDDRSRRAAG